MGIFVLAIAIGLGPAGPVAPPPRTTLSNPQIAYTIPEKPYVILQRGDLEVIIVDNRAVDDAVLPGHRSGYHGIAALRHRLRRENLFVPAYAGLNFEHIHDGTTQERSILFEPRIAVMQLRQIDPFTVELYQPPTPFWKLETALRYELLESSAIQMTIECIPHEDRFRNGHIGLFWASYIHQPESPRIHFRGFPAENPELPGWVHAFSPRHGLEATHRAAEDHRQFPHDKDFPLSLVFNLSEYCFVEPWYYGVSHGMAVLFVFRPKDQVRFSQSPTGGGLGNPAWDFQYFISPYKVGQRYQMIMRLVYIPYRSAEQMEEVARRHLAELAAFR
jgi:hypothetical protein